MSDAYRETLAALRNELALVDQKRQKIHNAISAIQDLMDPDRKGVAVPLSPIQTGAVQMRLTAHLGPTSYPDAAATVLREHGQPMHVMDIVKDMQRRGWFEDKKPKMIRASMVGTLNRKADAGDVFTKPKAATYGLVEWSKNGSHE